MKKILGLVIISFFLFGISVYGLAEERIVIDGTGDCQALLRILAAAFEKANPGTKIEVPDSVGSSGGIRAAAEGRCDFGRTVRPLKEKEKVYNLIYKPFAISPVVFCVNPNVTVDGLTKEEVVGIFSGKITLWSELGGEKNKIYIVQREEGDSSRNLLISNIPALKELNEFAGEVFYSTPEALAVVARYQNTMGYGSLSEAKAANLKIMKLEGVYPSAENVKNGSYKVTTQFALVWKGELKGLAKAFLDFLLSPEGQKIIAENGGVPAR